MNNPEFPRQAPWTPLREFMGKIGERRKLIETEFSGYSKPVIEKIFVEGRNDLGFRREDLYGTLLRYKKALTKEERSVELANYISIKAQIAEAAVKIGTKKVVEGDTLNKPQQENQVMADWTAYGISIGFTPDEALQIIIGDIKFTKAFQRLVGVSENPPEGGLRAAREKALEL